MVKFLVSFLVLVVSGCSYARLKQPGYDYVGVGFESPEKTARAHAIVVDADARARQQQAFSDYQSEMQLQIMQCIKEANWDCVEALRTQGYGGFSGFGGWGWRGRSSLPHTRSDADFYLY